MIGYVLEDENTSANEAAAKMVKLYIKNMVSIRCKLLVKLILAELDISYLSVELGEVILEEEISSKKLEDLSYCLHQSGLVLINDHKAVLVEKIKAVVIEMVHYSDEFPDVKHSVHISRKLQHNYTYLANLFSELKGITLEQFIILHKIEKVKELILYGEHNLTKIASKLNYSSSAHLSNQFKQVTGLTPTVFKKLKIKRLQPLEDL